MSAVFVDGRKALKSHVNKATDIGLVSAVKLWRRQFLAGHFRPIAQSKYNYKRRSFKYTRFKKRQAKRTGRTVRPLVLTGKSERLIRADKSPPILKKRGGKRKLGIKGNRGAELRIKAEKYFFQFKPGVSPDKVDELTRLTSGESATLNVRFRKIFDADLTRRTRARRKLRKVA